MRRVTLGVAALLTMVAPATADAGDLRSERQATIARLLTRDPLDYVSKERSTCAVGRQVDWIAQRRTAGLQGLPDATEFCVAALTRLGRDGALGFIRFPDHPAITSALAFDNGFVTAYRKREAMSPRLPTMGALKAVAERCLGLREPDTDLCYSVGYAFGVRAANGETITVN